MGRNKEVMWTSRAFGTRSENKLYEGRVCLMI